MHTYRPGSRNFISSCPRLRAPAQSSTPPTPNANRFLYHRLSAADARRCARGVRLARCASRRSTDRSRSPTRGAAGASRALAETQAARRRTRRGRSLQRSALQWTGVTTAPCGSQAHLTTHATASPRGPCALGCASARKPRRTASRPTESLRSLHRHKPQQQSLCGQQGDRADSADKGFASQWPFRCGQTAPASSICNRAE